MQFDVYKNPTADRPETPWLVDIQADLLSRLPTRLVVPLVSPDLFGPRVTRLHPLLPLFGEEFVLATHLLAAVGRRHLQVLVGSLSARRDDIVAAVDVLLAGI